LAFKVTDFLDHAVLRLISSLGGRHARRL